MQRSLVERIKDAFADVTSINEVRSLTEAALDAKISSAEIMQGMSNGLISAGEKYERGEFFLSELIMSGLMAQEVSNILKSRMSSFTTASLGKVVICTVKGDVHDLGKNLVSMLLASAGFEVVDLGVDVSTEKFVDAVQTCGAKIAAMSCLLTTAMNEMRSTMNSLKETNACKDVKVLVGGRPITSDFAKEIGADGYGADAIQALHVAKDAIDGAESIG